MPYRIVVQKMRRLVVHPLSVCSTTDKLLIQLIHQKVHAVRTLLLKRQGPRVMELTQQTINRHHLQAALHLLAGLVLVHVAQAERAMIVDLQEEEGHDVYMQGLLPRNYGKRCRPTRCPYHQHGSNSVHRRRRSPSVDCKISWSSEVGSSETESSTAYRGRCSANSVLFRKSLRPRLLELWRRDHKLLQ